MCSPELGKKSYKKERKKEKRTHIWTLYFTPLPGRPCVADVYHFWHVGSHRRRNHPCQILLRLLEGLGGYRCLKSGVSDRETLIVALTTVLRTTVLHCDVNLVHWWVVHKVYHVWVFIYPAIFVSVWRERFPNFVAPFGLHILVRLHPQNMHWLLLCIL